MFFRVGSWEVICGSGSKNLLKSLLGYLGCGGRGGWGREVVREGRRVREVGRYGSLFKGFRK